MSFKDFGLNEAVVRGVESMGYVDPTPIQLRAFPIILSGRDMMGSAQTGTGKTAGRNIHHRWENKSIAASSRPP